MDFSRKFFDTQKSIEKQRLFMTTIMPTWTKNITSDRGSTVLEQQRHGGLFLLPSSKT